MSPPKANFNYLNSLREKMWIIVFGTHTPAGKRFDLVLLWTIIGSIIVVMLESVAEYNEKYGHVFSFLEWMFTGFFTVEYLLRLWIVRRPIRYATSFLGIVDFLAVIPTYLTLFFTGGTYLIVIRIVRFFRVFRILKLTRQLKDANILARALMASRNKIFIFLGAVTALVIVTGTLMYLVEGGENGFTSIPRSVYWAIVTITTVGYGDIAPQTVVGQAFAALMMLMGYAIIAVPTGIVTAEIAFKDMSHRARQRQDNKQCPNCKEVEIDLNARFCRSCGARYPERST